MRVTELLAEKGIRPTTIREKALSILFEAGEPLSLKTLSGHFSEKRPDRVSLYRTLGLLETRGLVHKVVGADGVWRYCAHPPKVYDCPGNHAHFVCLSCGKMLCLNEEPIPVINLPPGYKVEGKQLLAYGLCINCTESSQDN